MGAPLALTQAQIYRAKLRFQGKVYDDLKALQAGFDGGDKVRMESRLGRGPDGEMYLTSKATGRIYLIVESVAGKTPPPSESGLETRAAMIIMTGSFVLGAILVCIAVVFLENMRNHSPSSSGAILEETKEEDDEEEVALSNKQPERSVLHARQQDGCCGAAKEDVPLTDFSSEQDQLGQQQSEFKRTTASERLNI
uniref:Uncharacterized protein n=1 Tax=Lotharella oceanica TaxID=641309 RepID=A0A7S2TQN5_9EUKA